VGLFWAVSGWAQQTSAPSAKEPASSLPTITKARQAHDLTSEEAKRAYPVHLRGVVTYFDPDTGTGFGALYVHDSSGSIFVKLAGGVINSLPAGTLVDVRGVSDPGGFAPVVARPTIQVIGHAALPSDANPVSRTQLFAGEYEGQWVAVEGIVRSVYVGSHTVILELAMMDGTLFATTVREDGVTYSGLVDSKVRIHGHEAPLYNSSAQMIGARVVFPNLSVVQVVEPAPKDPFQMPTVPIDNLLRWNQVSAMRHRVHIRGAVTLQWPGASLCVRDATRGICAQTVQDTHFAPGDVVDVVGFSEAENSTSVLTNAVFRKAGSGSPIPAEPVTVEQALVGKRNSELIQIEGELIGSERGSSDNTFMLTSGNSIFTAVLPRNLARTSDIAWKNGSRLRITGICSVEFDPRLSVLKDGVAVPLSFRILMRSPGDVAVVQGPPWWTPAHGLILLGLALTGTLVVLVWVVVLRRRVEQQTILLRESEERFRHMAFHDALTGLATRMLLQDRLDIALERARRYHTGLALLMLDIDEFKDINDTFGHHAGDQVLRVMANRIRAIVRKSDTVARMGGDEFLVLLPDLHDPHVAEGIAAKIVAALAVPIPLGGRELPISVSVGVCTDPGGELGEDALLKNVDLAMYQAKAKGRNCYQVFTHEMASAHTE
jgi:diguanylate cyclase (GGDEF)-like protein